MKFLELVPRDLDDLLILSKLAVDQYSFEGINIPDVQRLSIRSHEAAAYLLKHNLDAIPHLRCVSASIDTLLDIVSSLVDLGLSKVLVVNGDIPQVLEQTFDNTSLFVIEAIKEKFSDIVVYAALDPYRQNFKRELLYCEQKINAGADGFFSQPFFDSHLAAIYLDQFRDASFFIGSSPVLTDKSYQYWRNRNHVFFPSDFELTLDFNIKLAKDLISLVDSFKQHIYLMPILMDPLSYMKALD
ncbi:MAG: methylenetetrahydrofolate reductase [bacterium]